jgi:outer membrane protein insertion porin family
MMEMPAFAVKIAQRSVFPRCSRHLLLTFLITVLVALAPMRGWAQGFVVQDIRLEGLQRISPGTVFNYLPVKVGDKFDLSRSSDAIRSLFKTGFFADVRIEQEASTLVVFLVERPSIASVEFTGNQELETEALTASLEQVDFAVGRVFNKSVFDQVEQELRRSYFSVGRYGVDIVSTVTPLERNRVGIRFDVREGKTARIKRVNIVGNAVFEEEDLLDLFTLRTSSWWSVFSKDDQYSKQKLSADLESLRSHYLDQGFINFNIDSTQVSITPNKQDVYVTVNITEGEQFSIKSVRLAGDLLVDENALFSLVEINSGDIFSRKKITATQEALAKRLGEDGYAFANINAVPEIDESKTEVTLTFVIDPGKRVYVRRVNFAGNNKTQDEVLRREMRQIEGAWISTPAIERSKERLERLSYFDEVNVETPAVPGTNDQVDVNFNVVETPTGSLLLGAGFSQSQGVVLSTSLSQENFFGTGNRLTASFDNSDVNRNIGFSWFNPYFTDDGVSREFEAFNRRTDAADANLADYDLDEWGGAVNFGIPISEFNSFGFGLRAELTDFQPGGDASNEVLAFGNQFDNEFTTISLTGRFAVDTRDNRLLPNRGAISKITAEVGTPLGDMTFYKISFQHNRFFSIAKDWVISLNGEVGYGDGYGDVESLPLIDNFTAGGPRSVRGFEANTLGPRDSNGQPLGGSLLVEGQAELILPVPFAESIKQFRMAAFTDIGNVFGPNEDFDAGELRSSAGIAALWLSPLGPMRVSYAIPLRSKSGDDEQVFQFTFGTGF